MYIEKQTKLFKDSGDRVPCVVLELHPWYTVNVEMNYFTFLGGIITKFNKQPLKTAF